MTDLQSIDGEGGGRLLRGTPSSEGCEAGWI